MRDKVHGSVIRERGAQLRGIGADLAARFHVSQVGTVRPGLTLEQVFKRVREAVEHLDALVAES